jgi:hypothetical protein
MEINSIVVLSLHDPKERIWGQLLSIKHEGVTVRGLDLNSFDDFIRQLKNPEEGAVGLATIFYPMQRVERIALDEARGSIPSLSQTFARLTGQSFEEYLASLVET